MPITNYYSPEYDREISEVDLAYEERDVQLDVMRTWFYENFEDPAERTPYESGEGGYIWIWGGPYYANEELEEEFGGIVQNDVIEKLSSELDSECNEWGPVEKPSDYDQFLAYDISLITEYHDYFSSAILDIEKMLETKVDGTVEHCFTRLLYVNVITAMETYLSDAFINTVVSNKEYMRRFIESTPRFQKHKIQLSDVYNEMEKIEDRAKEYLIEVVWHNLPLVQSMYKAVFDIQLDDDLDYLVKAVMKRHDIVHRNGKTKKGEEILIIKSDVVDLLEKVDKLIENIDFKLGKIRAGKK